MSLLVRINLILGATLLLAAIALSYGCRSLLHENAKLEVMQEAGVMLDSALAIRNYTRPGRRLGRGPDPEIPQRSQE